jgi:RND family efflux transporter MFP subunit
VLLPASIVAAVVALLAYASRDALRPATEVRVVPVVVRTAAAPQGGAGPAAFTLQAPGWVEPDPYPVAVTALTDGVVEEVLVLEGERVEKGRVVARMIGDDARIALARAEAAVVRREGELAKVEAMHVGAQSEWDHPVERTRAVDAAQAMLAEARAELERLPSDIAAEQARVTELEDAARRKAQSAAVDAASESELIQTRLKLEAQRAVLAFTKANRPVLEAKVRQHEAALKAATENAKLRIAERQMLGECQAMVTEALAALDEARAARDEAKLRLSRMEVRSPAAGVVLSRHAEPGSTMMLNTDNARSAHVVRLYDPARLQVRVDVPLADAAKVSVGQAAKVVVGVLPDRTFDGVVTRISPEADIQRNTLQVKVRITDPAPELKPEMLARARFADVTAGSGTATTSSQQVFAPADMLRTVAGGNTADVWVVDRGSGRAARRSATLGEGRADGWVAVADGLRPGDALIAGDTSSLREGQRVKVVGAADAPGTAEPVDSAKGGSHGAH